MTSLILSAVCAVALSCPDMTPIADTTDLYLIDNERVEFFNGSQLNGKTIKSYNIVRDDFNGNPVRLHLIVTESAPHGSIRIVPQEGEKEDDKPWKIIPLEDTPKISVRTEPGTTAVDIVYIVDGVRIDAESFSKLSPADILSIEVMKGNSALGKLQKLKEEGVIKDESLVKGEVGDAGLILVTTKKGAK